MSHLVSHQDAVVCHVSVSAIPAHLVGSDYYNMMVEDDATSEETICVPARFYHAQTVPTSFVHGMQILETLRYWGCGHVPDEFYEAIVASPKLRREFQTQLPVLVEHFEGGHSNGGASLEGLSMLKLVCTMDIVEVARQGACKLFQCMLRFPVVSYDAGNVFLAIAESGSVDELNQFAHVSEQDPDESTCECAVKYGHLDVFRRLVDMGCPWDSSVLMAAAYYGHVSILQYLRDEDSQDADMWDSYTSHRIQDDPWECLLVDEDRPEKCFDYPSYYQRWSLPVPITDHLEERNDHYLKLFGGIPDFVFEDLTLAELAAANGQVHVLQFIEKEDELQQQVGGVNVFLAALSRGHMDTFQFLLEMWGKRLFDESEYEDNPNIILPCIFAASQGNLELLTQLSKVAHFPINVLSVMAAIFANDVPCLTFCVQRIQDGIGRWDEDLYLFAIRHGRFACVQALYAYLPTVDVLEHGMDRRCMFAAQYGQVEILRFLLALDMDMDTLKELWCIADTHGRETCCAFLAGRISD
jgi:hypothetical protein